MQSPFDPSTQLGFPLSDSSDLNDAPSLHHHCHQCCQCGGGGPQTAHRERDILILSPFYLFIVDPTIHQDSTAPEVAAK